LIIGLGRGQDRKMGLNLALQQNFRTGPGFWQWLKWTKKPSEDPISTLESIMLSNGAIADPWSASLPLPRQMRREEVADDLPYESSMFGVGN
jgi:hypothetical protein